MLRWLAPALAVVVLVSLVPRRVLAAERDSCIAAAEAAQDLRRAGKLTEARERLLTCSRPSCPVIIHQDCTTWMGQVLAMLPSVVLGARDAGGHDLTAVRVSIDGVVTKDALDGKPTDIDPGPHVFRFEAAGLRRIEQTVVVRAGEQNRIVNVTLPAAGTPATPEAPSRGVPAATWVLGSVSVATLASALALDLSAFHDAECKPHCDPTQVDTIKTKTYLAASLLGVGVVSFGSALVVLLVSRPGAADAHPPQGARRFDFDLGLLPRGGGGGFRARF
jgi:hypothetical protein